jgi:hypothetical protein
MNPQYIYWWKSLHTFSETAFNDAVTSRSYL